MSFQDSDEAWRQFEEDVADIYRALLHIEGTNAKIERNFPLAGLRYDHKVDVYYEFWHAGIKHRVAIECKRHSKPLDVEKVRAFAFVVIDVPGLVGAMVAHSGYDSGARELLQQTGILALEPKDLPSLPELILKFTAAQLQRVALPNEHAIGEPFWTIMESRLGEVTGTFHAVSGPNGKTMPLFLSKRHAHAYVAIMSDPNNWAVRGITQATLGYFLRLSELRDHFEFCIVLEEPQKGKAVMRAASASEVRHDFHLSSMNLQSVEPEAT